MRRRRKKVLLVGKEKKRTKEKQKIGSTYNKYIRRKDKKKMEIRYIYTYIQNKRHLLHERKRENGRHTKKQEKNESNYKAKL